MRIYLTRHGETIWNTQGRMQGWSNSDLTDKGIENARKLGQALKDIYFDKVYSSPSGRAIQTTNCIIENKNYAINTSDNLREMGFGDLEGMTQAEVEALYPEIKHKLWNEPHNYVPLKGETFEDVINRAKFILDEILSTPDIENVLVVTHAVLIKAIYFIIKNYTVPEFWNPPFINDTCLSIIEVKDGKVDFILEADISHL